MSEHKQRIVTWVNEQTDNTRMDTLMGAGDGARPGRTRSRRGKGGPRSSPGACACVYGDGHEKPLRNASPLR